jgi:predicted TIM-barrel fold metal-dependent hydrolase
MGARELSPSQEIRSRLNHPVIDSDGHIVEFLPAYFDYLKQVGGAGMVDRFAAGKTGRVAVDGTKGWYASTPEERAVSRPTRPVWWGTPTRNTLDRATSTLPRLLYKRLDEFGLDFSILYPSVGLVFGHFEDIELRQAACRAYNKYQSETFREFSDRLAPVAVIPMHTPQEAIAELEHAVRELRMKAILMPSYVLRQRADGKGTWYDNFCLDSQFDYDPVWAKCIELGVPPTFHSGTQGLAPRTSISNYMYNHIGHFGASGEALAKAAFFGGVTRRFPQLRMAFLEGGVGWGCSLYGDLIARWKKRNLAALENYNPAHLDRELFLQLHREYGGKLVEGRLDGEQNRAWVMHDGNPFTGRMANDPGPVDDFARCGITRPQDVKDLYVPNFFFGCEADDPINAWAFDSKKNAYGARLSAIFSSDIGHWDVPDMREVTEEAHELVDDGLITEEDFRDFVFANPVKFWTGMNPDFFKGTVIESHIKAAV